MAGVARRLARSAIPVGVCLDARLRSGLTVRGGFTTGRSTTDECDVAPKIDNPSTRFCHLETPFHTQFKGLAVTVIRALELCENKAGACRPGTPRPNWSIHTG